MKHLALVAACSLAIWTTAATAQNSAAQTIRVQPGQFCANNKCVRFSNDLGSVSIAARRSVSVLDYNLRSDPVISADEFKKIFLRALNQGNITSSDR